MRYNIFLRGINISGKNKIAMPELKHRLEEYDFKEVTTYLNSGNITLSSDIDDKNNITEIIENIIEKEFNLEIPVVVMLQEELNDMLNNAPEWWGTEDKEIYDNLIFILPPTTAEEVFSVIGEPKKDLEKVQIYKNVIFWSFIRKEYQKTNWWSKTAGAEVGMKLTIRTANTLRKVRTRA